MRASRLPGSDQASSFEPVFRRRSFEAIERAARRRVTLIVAPAGYGKSVAIGQYLARSAVPFVRFVARPGNATLLGFTRGLAQSFSAHAPGLGRGWFRAYQAAASAPDLPDALAAWFVANLGPGALTVVLDDLHVVADDSGAVQFLRSFIARSSNLAWILSSRDAITLPYATWLAYGQADEPIEADVLRIHPDEAAGIVRACNVVLDSERVAELLALVDGWPAAFMFALRAAAGSSDAAQVLACSRESLYTYLADQVFTAFSRREQRFLLDTALLPAVDLDVLAAADWESPREVYADLRRHAHFIVAESATVFRYHDLFREFLVHRLRSQGSIAFYRAQLASADLSEAADWTGAALRLRTEAGDEVGITRMLRVESARRFLAVGLEEVDGALAALPESQLRSDAALL
ncbi:MAG: hypothetical protein ACREM6_09915, partial [Vulcanimicrobiaceae bacterium]